MIAVKPDRAAPDVADLWRMSVLELATAIKTRHVSVREVIDSHLRRIEAVNGAINAVVMVMADQALEEAAAADRMVAANDLLPPFHGVPFTVKQNIDVAGTPTTQGLKMLADAYPIRDAPIVQRLRAAGGIPIGRTNMPSGGMRWHCESELWGATLNPWDPSRTPGASSAGEAVAIARGDEPARARKRWARLPPTSGPMLRDCCAEALPRPCSPGEHDGDAGCRTHRHPALVCLRAPRPDGC